MGSGRGVELDQPALQKSCTELPHVLLDLLPRLVVLSCDPLDGLSDVLRLLHQLKHPAGRRVEPVILARRQVQHDHLGREGSMHDVLGHPHLARHHRVICSKFVGRHLSSQNNGAVASALSLDDRPVRGRSLKSLLGMSMTESLSAPSNDAPYRLIDSVSFGGEVIVHAFTNLYGCEIGARTRIGPFVEIQRGVSLGPDCKVQSHTFICTGVRIGTGVFIGHGVIFINDKHPRATNEEGRLQADEDWELLETVVESGASVGSGAVVLGGVRIGEGATIGAGAVVAHDVAAGETVVGSSARAFGTLSQRDRR